MGLIVLGLSVGRNVSMEAIVSKDSVVVSQVIEEFNVKKRSA